ncbi:patatin-like phospholipase family protein [Sphaerisporangium sp. TRM90804]|uniref:patatin-like phospholipase family protein n=1 Tax=Sphaerisporangium sp. TRM90804 TaxID=3031113 RepID=UPI002448E2DA|nr:patatin-like phospholipase family protein [Sphaerisporangium sp. TRM90804]MDH2428378.1 patatin-like phospholipase family protein [Sphaerisporangium sp. TRM90804]
MASRALVLGSGGVVGIAWQTGVLAGLAEQGVDLGEADLLIGTSAGAVVGAQLAAGVDPERLYAGQLVPPDGEPAPRTPMSGLVRLVWNISRSKTTAEFGARMGRIALSAATVPEAERRAEIARWLGDVRQWPARPLVITAVDAETGERVTFDAASGAGLVDCVAASAAGPGIRPPATIGGRRYIDGGMSSPGNVDLAAGYDRVVVLAPVTRGGGVMKGVAEQIAELSPRSRTALIEPGPEAWKQVVGRSLGGMMNPAHRPAAARAGHAQALREAPRIAELWRP